VDLSALNLQGANLIGALLTDAYLMGARFDRANLGAATLENADLSDARLTSADLRDASLEGADLHGATLSGANLSGARLDRDTRFNDATLAGVSVDQSALDRVNLTVVSWEGVAPLGEEVTARARRDALGERKSRATRIEEYEAAVRANRLLATSLKAQGLAENADVFAYRTQILQRKLHFRWRRFGRWSASWFLAALSGYGYRLGNIFVAYGLVLAAFALIFWALGVRSFDAAPPYQALWDSFLVSLAAIHGRALIEQLGAWTPAAWVAAVESVIGIVIEGVFVAMIIQRLFR
jgi:hypothetical protein